MSRMLLNRPNNMLLDWHLLLDDTSKNRLIKDAALNEKALVVGRVGLILLSCGTGAWRVREAMNSIATNLGIICVADVGFTSINLSCFDSARESYSQTYVLSGTGVNTDKLSTIDKFVKNFGQQLETLTVAGVHDQLETINKKTANYNPVINGLAAALACSCFIFLLGGGIPEMIGSFIGAGVGNLVKSLMTRKHYSTLISLGIAVAVAGLAYVGTFHLMSIFIDLPLSHESGYIGAMLFVIPGFPFITSMLDISKLDMRSGIERLSYATMITVVSALVGWVIAASAKFYPADFVVLPLTTNQIIILQLIASFGGVFGFSVMFNSPINIAITASLIGAVANTTRLSLISLYHVQPSWAAFIGALIAGVLASIVNHYKGYPRITLTVPAIVIMVPGLYIYKAIYYIGFNQLATGLLWLNKAILIILFLPLGLFVARSLLDYKWQHFN